MADLLSDSDVLSQGVLNAIEARDFESRPWRQRMTPPTGHHVLIRNPIRTRLSLPLSMFELGWDAERRHQDG